MESLTDRPNPVNLPEAFMIYLEQNYYSQITQLSTLETIINDPNFLSAPLKHVALFSDHGISHGHDIANKITHVLNQINGLLIPHRDPVRLDFMVGYGVILAYLHDIGLRNYTAFGRAVHPEFAAQLVFTQDFDPMIDLLWQHNSGNLPWKLLDLSARGLLTQPPQIVLRELLSLSLCHSKSKVSIETFNDLPLLRQTMQTAISTELHYLYHQQQVAAAEKQLRLAEKTEGYEGLRWYGVINQVKAALQSFMADKRPEELLNQQVQRYYENLAQDAFAWLTSPNLEVQEFVQDVIDTLRALRCADAFRERGATFKTSAGYEVFVNRNNAYAMYALRSHDRSSLFLLEGKDPISAGEANMTGASLDREGNLRVSFACGSFANPEAQQWAIHSAAVVIQDIQADVIESFRRSETPADQSVPYRSKEMKILIEDTVDNMNFAELVGEELCRLNPTLRNRIQPVVSLQGANLNEVKRYLNGVQPDWNLDKQQMLFNRLAAAGHKIDTIDPEQAFREVRVIQIEAGEVLIEPGSPSCFVYIPFAEGLRIFCPSSPSQAVLPWIQVGNIEMIRGSVHHNRVIAEQDLSVLMIPQEIYLRHWYSSYSVQEFTALCTSEAMQPTLQPRGSLSLLTDQILQKTIWQ